jgi:hypothetical protein
LFCPIPDTHWYIALVTFNIPGIIRYLLLYRIKAHSASVKHKSIVPKVRSQEAKYDWYSYVRKLSTPVRRLVFVRELLGVPNSSRNSEMFEKMNRKYEIIKCFIFSLKY